jgi:DNA-binding MarR family transcriptional regulator
MTPSEGTTDQFVELVQRLMRLRPKLLFQDESVARIKSQLRQLKDSGAGNQEDRIFLFRILHTLISSETPPTMGELSAGLGIPLSSTTRMADGLVRAKFAERCDDEHDRRIVRLCVTPTGRQFIEMATSVMRGRIQHLLNHFSAEEQAQLLRLMNKLIDSIETENKEDIHETI